MDWMDALKGFASVTTVIGAVLVAANISAKAMVVGFVIFIAASLAWIGAGWYENEPSVYVQNLALFIINVFGVYRWLPRATR